MNNSLVDKIKNMLDFSKRNNSTMTGSPADEIIVHPGGRTTQANEERKPKYNIPNDREEVCGPGKVTIGSDDSLKSVDTKNQLKRRIAMKLIKANEAAGDNFESGTVTHTALPPTAVKPKKTKDTEIKPFAPMATEDSDPCWDNYKQLGMKKKNGKKVPNCIPEEKSVNRIKYNDKTDQWHHSFNGGFSWKPVSSDEAKKISPVRHASISSRYKLDK